MARFIFFYTPGNLDSALTHLTEINDIYRLCETDEEFAESLLESEQRGGWQRGQPWVHRRSGKGLLLNLVSNTNGERSLVLEGPLRDLDGAVYQARPNRRNHVTVRDAASQLIKKHGEYQVPELTRRFTERFDTVLDEDYGRYELLMFQFFLQNLPLLNALDLTQGDKIEDYALKGATGKYSFSKKR